MQTFLPYADFTRSAAALDRLRLGKQRVENLQVMRASARLSPLSSQNHPIAVQWRGFEATLLDYQESVVARWRTEFGFQDTCWAKTVEAFALLREGREWARVEPPWLGHEEFHAAYRSLLLRKAPEFYTDLFPDTPPDLPDPWVVASTLNERTTHETALPA